MNLFLNDDKSFVKGTISFPVTKRFDVLVAGGGLAGFAAAVSAARNGASVCLIERTQTIGGTATAGLMNLFYAPYNGLTGIGKELFERLVAKKAAIPGETVPFDIEQCTLEMFDMLQEAGVHLMLDTWVVDVIRDNADIAGICTLNKSGFSAMLACRIVDASGDGDVCAAADYAYMMGRESDQMMRPMTLLFSIGGIDVHRLVSYVQENPSQFAPDPNQCIVNMELGELRIFGFFDLVRKARENGDLDDTFHYFRIESIFADKGIGTVNTIRVYKVDGTSGDDISAAVISARKQQKQLLKFMRSYIPGLENCYLLTSAQSIGVRDSRRIVGEYKMTEGDITDQVVFTDCIGIGKNRQVLGFKGEGHSPDGGEGSEQDSVIREAIADYVEYQIPYRILIPKDSKRILVAGKMVSCDIMANKHLRNQPPCMITGEAAGAAAALSASSGVNVGDIDIRRLQSMLGIDPTLL